MPKAKAKSERRIVNLTELGDVFGLTDKAMAELLRRHPGFPILQRGARGISYQFDLDDAVAWWKAHKAKGREADEKHRSNLQAWKQEVYGEVGEQVPALSAADRKALADAIKTEDYNRRTRGELVDRTQLEPRLTAALVRLRQELLEVPAVCAKRLGLDRDQRIEIERLITVRLDEMAQTLGEPEAHSEPAERAA